MRRKIIGLFFVIIIIAGLVWAVKSLSKPSAGVSSSLKWHAAFSKSFAIQMGLDWRETYLAILNDLKPRSVRTAIYWPDVEPQSGKYTWDDYDWMVQEAQKRNISMVLVVGRKLPRWPECYVPDWASSKNEAAQQGLILDYIREAVNRYKKEKNLRYWQVENEPFLPFGNCPATDSRFLDKEIPLVRLLDPDHQILITDSGELSDWFRAASRADVFGTTMYRIIWKWPLGYFRYPLPPSFFWFKTNLIRIFHPNKPVIVSELQAEPWGPKLIFDMPVIEQLKSMNLRQFSDNIEYAKSVGFPEVYLWGSEWWYWMKTKQNHSEFWDKAGSLINH